MCFGNLIARVHWHTSTPATLLFCFLQKAGLHHVTGIRKHHMLRLLTVRVIHSVHDAHVSYAADKSRLF